MDIPIGIEYVQIIKRSYFRPLCRPITLHVQSVSLPSSTSSGILTYNTSLVKYGIACTGGGELQQTSLTVEAPRKKEDAVIALELSYA
jgi:hypothetical protein